MQAAIKGPRLLKGETSPSRAQLLHVAPEIVTWLGFKHENFNDYPLIAPYLTWLARWRGPNVDYLAGRNHFRLLLFRFLHRFLHECGATKFVEPDGVAESGHFEAVPHSEETASCGCPVVFT